MQVFFCADYSFILFKKMYTRKKDKMVLNYQRDKN